MAVSDSTHMYRKRKRQGLHYSGFLPAVMRNMLISNAPSFGHTGKFVRIRGQLRKTG